MNQIKIGQLIRRLRTENNLTQLRLAEQMQISDKTISKWERGLGCPDVSLLPELSRIFHVDMEKLLAGELNANEPSNGNMKKMQFYVCPHCGNTAVSPAGTALSCCGKKLQPLVPQAADGSDRLTVEILENEYFITGSHPMQREHSIAFAAFLTGDTLILRRLYPEWDLQVRIPFFAHGTLLWYCTKHGLFYQRI